ncbi:unnamed protein product [Eruca vesicaria subsp. sativa]|uniref:Uncharacterized protein n=1 Tax=Eruca vesicaria subsp. sativa TaxID=29727 RepID=A0ABC8M5C6_ERUVS|nr:unnamed protein product [Eruca vesicaria subsp. sativa]
MDRGWDPGIRMEGKIDEACQPVGRIGILSFSIGVVAKRIREIGFDLDCYTLGMRSDPPSILETIWNDMQNHEGDSQGFQEISRSMGILGVLGTFMVIVKVLLWSGTWFVGREVSFSWLISSNQSLSHGGLVTGLQRSESPLMEMTRTASFIYIMGNCCYIELSRNDKIHFRSCCS